MKISEERERERCRDRKRRELEKQMLDKFKAVKIINLIPVNGLTTTKLLK